MIDELKARALALLGRGFRGQLEEACEIVVGSLQSAQAIAGDLDSALELVSALGKADTDEARVLIGRFGALMNSITAAASAKEGARSLVDGGGYTLTLREKGDAGWLRQLDHMSLAIAEGGLVLPTAADLDNSEMVCKTAKADLEGAIKKTRKTITQLCAHQKALGKKRDALGSASASGGDANAISLPQDAKNSIIEITQIVVIALAIALVFRSFLFQPFHIPSGSMKPTLLKGDYLFVSKFAYGYSNKSFPFGVNFLNGRIFQKEPERGDVIVFKLTSDGRTDYIKRVVGLPGDRMQMKNGVLFINDEKVSKVRSEDYLYTDDNTMEQFLVSQHIETLPNGVTHNTLDMTVRGRNDNTGIFNVPVDHYFFMGDNRDNSQDSRVFGGGVGFVPAENLVGRAELIFISVDGSARLWQIWKWPTAIRYGRFFKKV